MTTKQKISIIGLGIMSLLLAASVSLTIAWFDGSSHLAVNNLNIRLIDRELSISTDNKNFKSYLSSDELNDAGKFRAVSSSFSESWIEEKQEKPLFREGYVESNKNVINQSDSTSIATTGYFTQEFFIKSNTSVYVTLDKERTTFLPDENDNKSAIEKIREKFPGLQDEEILQNLNNVVKSLRLSILVLNDEDDNSDNLPDYSYYIIDPYKDGPTYFSGILDTDMNGFYDYSKENKEILYGESTTSNGKTVEECLVYKEPQPEDETVGATKLSCFTSGTKQGVSRINFEQSIANGLVLKEENSIAIEDAEDEILIPLTAQTSKRIVLSFYQEGWDLENTDFVRYSHFFVNVLFKIAKVRY